MMDYPYQLAKRGPSSDSCRLVHDFSNDLAVILRRCDLLIGVLGSNAEATKHLRLIQEAARHMTDRIVDPCQLVQDRLTAGEVREGL